MGNNTLLKSTPIRIKLHNSLYSNPSFANEFRAILNEYLSTEHNSSIEIDSFDLQSKAMRFIKDHDLQKYELDGCIYMSLLYMINKYSSVINLSREEKDMINNNIKIFINILYLSDTCVAVQF